MEEKIIDNKEEPIVVEGTDVDVSNFGFEKVEDTDKIKFDNQRDYIICLINGTTELYDSMLGDSRLSDDARVKLESLKQEKLSLLLNELSNQLDFDFNNLMDKLSSSDISLDEKDNVFSEAQEIIKICRDELHDDKKASEFDERINTLQNVMDSIDSQEEVKSDSLVHEEVISEKHVIDFSSMTNNELYQYLFDLEEKIKDAAKRNADDEVHQLLADGVILQEEIDKRISGITAKVQEEPIEQHSLESELDDFAKEQKKIINSKHFTTDAKKEMLDDLYNEREAIESENVRSGRKR